MGADRTHPNKNERIAPIGPSFVYRQDGYELSYKVEKSIPQAIRNVKWQLSLHFVCLLFALTMV